MERVPASATTGYLVWRLAMKWRAAADRALEPLGLTHAQYAVLAPLYGLSRSGAQPSQRQIADYTGVDQVYVSKLVRALHRSGLVNRAENPADPRAVQLTLTDHGTEVAQRAMSVIHGLQDELTAPLGGTDSHRTRQLRESLRALLGDA